MNADMFLTDDEINYQTTSFPEPRPFQNTAHDKLRHGAMNGHRCQMIMAPTGAGKCLGKDTPVLMANGAIKLVQDVVVGDKLIGPDSKVRNVISITKGEELLYKITPTKGDYYIVNSSHILSLRKTPGSDAIYLFDGSKIEKNADIVNVNVETLFYSNKTAKHCLKGWRSSEIDFQGNEFSGDDRPIPPYILGAWLGDGCLGQAKITKPPCNMVDAWIEYGKSIGYSYTLELYDDKRCPTYRLTNGKDGLSFNLVKNNLEAIGVLNKKHIPGSYKYASIQDRRELLAGLIDSDGHIDKSGCDWISYSKELAEDFCFLCRSLGLSCYLSYQPKHIKELGFTGWYWRASVSGDLSLIPTKDKKAPERLQKKRTQVHGITIEPIGVGDYYGFEIDGDHLFLLGDFTVTHNTYLGMRIMHEALKKGRRALFVCDRTTLIDQTSNVADMYGLSAHGVVQASHWRTNSRHRLQIASVQTLARRKWPDADVIVIDEAHCFVGETLVSTPDGEKRIDSLNIGDCIYNSCGKSYIIHVFKNTVLSTIKIRLSNEQTIECTPEHPFFTEMGWRPAGTLERGTRLFRKEELQGLWQGIYSSDFENRDSCWTSRIGGSIQQEELLQSILREEIEKPNAQQSYEGEGFEFFNCDWSQTSETGRERAWYDESSIGNAEFIREGVDCGICGEDAQEQQAGLSASLQNRYCESNIGYSNRTGRQEPSFLSQERAGQKEGRFIDQPWVESIEIVEHRGGITVYNLQVGTHPSYFANGILVHNCQYKAWVDYIQTCRANVIGLSATPFSKGLGLLFSNLINAATMHDLTESGVLVPMRVMSCKKIDMKGAETLGGEWSDSAAAKRGMEIVGDVVAEWQQYASDRKTIVFGATIKHCEEMAKQFNSAGIRAEVFSSETTLEEREVLLREYKKPDSLIRVLISVEALAKGFDVADVSCVCDCRPLRKSLSTAIQMWGRGLRSSPQTEKKDCILLDFSGNIVRFAEDFEDIFFNGLDALDAGEKLDRTIRKDDEDEEKEPSKCPACGNTPFFKKCTHCGHERKVQSLIEHLPGEMAEFKIGKHHAADNAYQLYQMCCTYARERSAPEKQSGRAWHLYKDIFGKEPNKAWRFDATPNAPISKAVYNKIMQQNIAYAKAMQKAKGRAA